jgi:hypothetical protein
MVDSLLRSAQFHEEGEKMTTKKKPAPARDRLNYYHNATKLTLSTDKEIRGALLETFDEEKSSQLREDPLKCDHCEFALTTRQETYGDEQRLYDVCEGCGHEPTIYEKH